MPAEFHLKNVSPLKAALESLGTKQFLNVAIVGLGWVAGRSHHSMQALG